MRVYGFGADGVATHALTELALASKCDGGRYQGTTHPISIGRKYNVTWVVANVVLSKGDHGVADDKRSTDPHRVMMSRERSKGLVGVTLEVMYNSTSTYK